MTRAADKEKSQEPKSTDDIQNGGKGTVEERLDTLERRLDNVCQRNHLLEADR